MNAIFVLLPLALLIAGIALALFIWAVRSGQYDDLETPALRVLFDDEQGRRASSTAPAGTCSPGIPGDASGAPADIRTATSEPPRRSESP